MSSVDQCVLIYAIGGGGGGGFAVAGDRGSNLVFYGFGNTNRSSETLFLWTTLTH